MLNRILVAIDHQSAASHQALASASELAQALSAELLLVHALDVFDPLSPERPKIPVNSYSMGLDRLAHAEYERQWAEFVQHYEALLQQMQSDAEAIGIQASYLQPYGRPGPAICKAALDHQADLIVVGSHGRHGLPEMLLGSVSNYIMHHAPCSVMVTHPHLPSDAAARPAVHLSAAAVD